MRKWRQVPITKVEFKFLLLSGVAKTKPSGQTKGYRGVREMKLQEKADNQNKLSMYGLISVMIASLLLLLLINNFVEIIPLQRKLLQGGAVLLPIFISPIGGLIGYIGLRESNDKISYIGLISNIVLSAVPFLYMIFGTLIFGV